MIRIDHCLVSTFELPAGGWFSCILLHRATGGPDFAPRHRHWPRLFHEELGRLIGPVLTSGGDPSSPTRLPPRVREALSCLLDGDCEKQVAARMGLSRETVHQYVKTLYRHYRVGSRAELLARVLRRTIPAGEPDPRPGAGDGDPSGRGGGARASHPEPLGSDTMNGE